MRIITSENLLCFQRFPLRRHWQNRSAFLLNTQTSDTSNYSHVSSVNCDLCLPEIKIRSSSLLRRKKRNLAVKHKWPVPLSQNTGFTNLFISEKHKCCAFRVLTGRFASFSGLLSFYRHCFNSYLSLRCQVFLSLSASFLKFAVWFLQMHWHSNLQRNYLPTLTQGSQVYQVLMFAENYALDSKLILTAYFSTAVQQSSLK